MSLASFFERDPFLDESEIQFQRNCQIGPWIQSHRLHQQKQKQHKIKDEGEGEKYSIKRLYKRKSIVPKEIGEVISQFATIQPIKGIKVKKYQNQQKSNVEIHDQCQSQCFRKNWTPLNTTIYTYQYRGKESSPGHKNKRQQMCSEKSSRNNSFLNQRNNKGSDNLQKILKIKQKMRMKNQLRFQKMKQKFNSLEKQCGLTQRNWNSSILPAENKIHRNLIFQKIDNTKLPLKYSKQCKRMTKNSFY